MKDNFIVVKNFLDPSFSQSLYEYLKFSTQVSILRGEEIYTSKNVSGCICQKANDLMLDAVLKTSKEKVENITGLNLIPDANDRTNLINATKIELQNEISRRRRSGVDQKDVLFGSNDLERKGIFKSLDISLTNCSSKSLSCLNL